MEPSIPKSEFKLPAFQNEKEKYAVTDIAQKYGYKDWKEVAKKGGLNDLDIQKIEDACEDPYQGIKLFTIAA